MLTKYALVAIIVLNCDGLASCTPFLYSVSGGIDFLQARE